MEVLALVLPVLTGPACWSAYCLRDKSNLVGQVESHAHRD